MNKWFLFFAFLGYIFVKKPNDVLQWNLSMKSCSWPGNLASPSLIYTLIHAKIQILVCSFVDSDCLINLSIIPLKLNSLNYTKCFHATFFFCENNIPKKNKMTLTNILVKLNDFRNKGYPTPRAIKLSGVLLSILWKLFKLNSILWFQFLENRLHSVCLSEEARTMYLITPSSTWIKCSCLDFLIWPQ